MIEWGAAGFATAFAAGAVSFLSPCVLPLVPGYVSYIAGQPLSAALSPSRGRRRLAAAALSSVFVLGFGTVFVALGASATALGSLLLQYRYEANLLGGALIMLFGALLAGADRWMKWSQRDLRFHPRLAGGHPAAAYALGLAFGFGWTPCIGPVLGAILTLSAAQGSVAGGMVLLAFYAAGLGVPFIATALFTRVLAARLRALSRAGRALQVAAGAVLMVMGVAMMSGKLTELSYWLLRTFPALGRVG